MAMMVGMPFPGEGRSIFLSQKRDHGDPTGIWRCFAQCSQGAFAQLLHLSMHLGMQRDMGGKRPEVQLGRLWAVGCELGWELHPFLGVKLLQPSQLRGSGSCSS